MGIRVYDDFEKYRIEHWYQIKTNHINLSNNQSERAVWHWDCEMWCLRTLHGEFDLRYSIFDVGHYGYFKSEKDAMIYALRWG